MRNARSGLGDLKLTRQSYLQQRACRLQSEKITQCAAFGLVLGVGFSLYGAIGYSVGLAFSDMYYLAFMCVGLVLLGFGIAQPLLLDKPSALFRVVAGKLGHFIFQVLLIAIYYALLTPLAVLRSKQSPQAPFVAWASNTTGHGYGWSPKQTRTMVQAGKGKANLAGTFYAILVYFARHGRWFMLPLLVVLLSLGLLLFFAQTSAFAPFIYTLF